MSLLRGKRALHARTFFWYMNSFSTQKRKELYRDAGLPGAMRVHWLGEWLSMNMKEKPEKKREPGEIYRKACSLYSQTAATDTALAQHPAAVTQSLQGRWGAAGCHGPHNLPPLLKLPRGDKMGWERWSRRKWEEAAIRFPAVMHELVQMCDAQPLIELS